MLTRVAATLLCLLPLTAAASAETLAHPASAACSVQLHQTDIRQSGHAVSARLLAIPARAWQHYSKAVAAAAANHPELAEREAAQALALAPTFAEVYLLRALQTVVTGHPAEALPLLTTAHTLAPDLPWVRIAAAGALNQLGRFDQAIAELAGVAGADATSWQALYERSRAEIGLGHPSASLHWSELAVAAAPVGCTEARLLRANALHLAGRSAEVITELETYLAEDRLGTRRTQIQSTVAQLRAARQPISPEQATLPKQTASPDQAAAPEQAQTAAAPSPLGRGLLAMN